MKFSLDIFTSDTCEYFKIACDMLSTPDVNEVVCGVARPVTANSRFTRLLYADFQNSAVEKFILPSSPSLI